MVHQASTLSVSRAPRRQRPGRVPAADVAPDPAPTADAAFPAGAPAAHPAPRRRGRQLVADRRPDPAADAGGLRGGADPAVQLQPRRPAAQRLQHRADLLHHPGVPLLHPPARRPHRRARRVHGAARDLARGGDLPRLRQRPDRLHHQPVAGAVRRLLHGPGAGAQRRGLPPADALHAAHPHRALPLRPRRVRRALFDHRPADGAWRRRRRRRRHPAGLPPGGDGVPAPDPLRGVLLDLRGELLLRLLPEHLGPALADGRRRWR